MVFYYRLLVVVLVFTHRCSLLRTCRNFVDFDTCTGRSGKAAKAAKASGKSSKSKEGGVDAKADKVST